MNAAELLNEYDGPATSNKKPGGRLSSADLLKEHDAAGAPKAPDTAPPASSLPTSYQGGEGFDLGQSAQSVGKHIYGKYIQPEVIPTLAALAATKSPALALGSRVGVLAAPAIEAGIQGAAGYLGEKANQALGITPPSETDAAIRGLTSGGIAGAGAALRITTPFLGRAGVVKANEQAAKEAQSLVQGLIPAEGTQGAFARAFTGGAAVPTTATEQQLLKLTGQVREGQSKHWAYGPAAEDIKAIQTELDAGPLSAERWQFLHTRLGAKIGSMEGAKVKAGLSEAKALYRTMYEDIEKAATAPTYNAAGQPTGSAALLEGLKGYKREQAVERLGNEVEKAMQAYRGRGGDIQFNADSVIRAMNKDRFLDVHATGQAAKSQPFSATELHDIRKTLTMLNTVPAVSTLNSGGTLSQKIGSRVGVAGLAGLGGYSAIGPLEGAAAAAGVLAIGAVSDASKNLAFALQTKSGRALVKELTKGKGGWLSNRSQAVLGGYVAALRSNPDTEMAQ